MAGSPLKLRGTKAESFFTEISGTSLHFSSVPHDQVFVVLIFLASFYSFGVKHNALSSFPMREKRHYNCKIP